MKRKGIVLAGGSGTRLLPLTKAVSKQILPVYNKPMIYYPISVLMLANIKEILIISTPNDINTFKRLFSDGSALGLRFHYEVQNEPKGIAEALIIGERFLDGAPSTLILGDNIFFGKSFSSILRTACEREIGATIFTSIVSDPERYGVARFSEDGKVIDIEEKPLKPKSSDAVTGLYFFDPNASRYAKDLVPSKRGELEITELNQVYLKKSELFAEKLGIGFSWFDAGTHKSLLDASNYIHTIASRQGIEIACLEEIAFKKGWIDTNSLRFQVQNMGKNSYSEYLGKLVGFEDEG